MLVVLVMCLLREVGSYIPRYAERFFDTQHAPRLHSSSSGGEGGGGDTRNDRLASTIKAAASVQSSSVFKVANQLDEITDSYNTMLSQMESLQEKALQELQKKKSKQQEQLDGKDDVLFVRLVSMSPRELYVWAIDAQTNLPCTSFPIASFESAASVITTGTTGDRYVYSHFADLEGDMKNGLGFIEVHNDKELYLLYDDEKHPPTSTQLDWLNEVQKHSEHVKSKTGRSWQHYYSLRRGPREPPVHYMWDTKVLGQKYTIHSNVGHWMSDTNKHDDLSAIQSEDPVDITLEVVSSEPKVLMINNFLSHFECDLLIELGRDRMKDSCIGTAATGGSKKTQHRTSRNGWIYRSESPFLDSIYRRTAHLLKIDEALLKGHGRIEGVVNAAEPLQIVNYQVGQKYDYHYDWTIGPHPNSRYITLLLYLNDKEDENSGGETAFYRGQIDESKHDPSIIQPVDDHSSVATGCVRRDRGFKIHPGKGNAVLFYNLCEDGNGDVKSQHAALPVKKGEKWLANLWIWDPVLPDSNSFAV